MECQGRTLSTEANSMESERPSPNSVSVTWYLCEIEMFHDLPIPAMLDFCSLKTVTAMVFISLEI